MTAERPTAGQLDLVAAGRGAARGRHWGRDTVLIAVTGWDHEDNRRRIVEAAFDADLVKAVDPSSVAQLLASRLRAPQGARTAEGRGPGQSS
jgi:hypothetical protein